MLEEATSKTMLELLQSVITDGSSGLTWLFMFMDTLFSGSTACAELVIECFSDENLEQILVSMLHLISLDNASISRDESFSLLSCFESLLTHISDEDIESKIDTMQVFSKVALFILNTGFEIVLARDNELFISFLMLIRTNFELIHKQELLVTSSLKTSVNDLIEVFSLI